MQALTRSHTRALLEVTCMPGEWMGARGVDVVDRNCKMLEIGGWIPILDQACEEVKGCAFSYQC